MKKVFRWFSKKKPAQADKEPEILPSRKTDKDFTEETHTHEEDVPTDNAALFPEQNTIDLSSESNSTALVRQKCTHKFRKKIIMLSSLGALAILLVIAGILVLSIMTNPMGQFESAAEQIATPLPSIPAETHLFDSAVQSPSPTPDPYEILMLQADIGFLKDIVNIMLIGVDHAEERETWTGKKAFHADVMIVLSVNKNTGAVNMISLPRDTYANIPGVDGIYKLNASIDCGGGWPSEVGFNKVCEAAEWMLGGIPVDYYYAVDMGAVKGLVDVIGGVQDFDVEMDFQMQGRSYHAGIQNMDGQAVLDYLRVRKGISESGDLNRINRQKKMLVAIFDKIQRNGLLTNIPGIIDAFSNNLYTNTTLAQTAALAAFAYNVDPDNIGMYSMGGKYNYGIFNWNFVLTDQKSRVELIKKIYGVDVDQYKDFTPSAAVAKWNRMQVSVVRSKSKSVLSKVKAKLDADAKLPIFNVAPTQEPTASPTQEPTASPTQAPTTSPTQAPTTAPTQEPTTAPTQAPTAAPTQAPTTAPTQEPTAPPIPQSTPLSNSESIIIAPMSNSNSMGIGLLSLGTINPKSSTIMLGSGAPSGYRQYLPDGMEWMLYNKAKNELNSLSASTKKIEQLKSDIESLCKMFSIRTPNWRVNYETRNEVIVDFR